MRTERPVQQQRSEPPKEAAPAHSWLSNPLDWPQIDRMILLAYLILFSPVLVGGGTVLLWVIAPQYLVTSVAIPMLTMYVIYTLLLITFILVALKKRQHQDHWELMESFVMYSYLVTTFIGAWLSGTQFTSGVLLLLLGVNIAAPFTNIHRLKRAYALSYVVFFAFIIMSLSGRFTFAPVFAESPFRPDGTPQTFWMVFQIGVVIATLVFLYISLISTERWGSRESLYREMSTVDGLTRLTNRRSFIERGENEFLRAARSPSATLSCIMMDIDHFKRINDTYGHQAGDAVLVRVSQILMSNARQYDEVGRYGGEEFAVLLPGTPLVNALRVAERLRANIEASSVDVDGQTLSVTASFGVACYPCGEVNDINSLLKAADVALYDAKHGGRNRVVAAASGQEALAQQS